MKYCDQFSFIVQKMVSTSCNLIFWFAQVENCRILHCIVDYMGWDETWLRSAMYIVQGEVALSMSMSVTNERSNPSIAASAIQASAITILQTSWSSIKPALILFSP